MSGNSSVSTNSEVSAIEPAKSASEVVRTRLTSSTRTSFSPLKKIAQDRSDQQLAPSSNRIRQRTKHRGGLAAASTAVLTGAGGGAAALALSKKDKKDKDGHKVIFFK